jgi:hypothetical protein
LISGHVASRDRTALTSIDARLFDCEQLPLKLNKKGAKSTNQSSDVELNRPMLAVGTRRQKRRITMDEMTPELHSIEDETSAAEVCDEILEAAAEPSQAGIYTLGACTGLSVCPA